MTNKIITYRLNYDGTIPAYIQEGGYFPNTVAGAIKAILHLQPYMLTVHLSGGYDMLMKANEIVSEYCLKNAIKKPIIHN